MKKEMLFQRKNISSKKITSALNVKIFSSICLSFFLFGTFISTVFITQATLTGLEMRGKKGEN
jgi:hypothetical protein